MTEAQYARKLRAAIKQRFGDRCVVLKIHGGPQQEAGISDLLLCAGGRFIAVELKQRGNKPTALQQEFLRRIVAAGGIAWTVYTHESVSVILSLIDLYVREGKDAELEQSLPVRFP